MKRRHLKMSKGRGSIPPDILMEIVRKVIAEHKLKEKASRQIAKKRATCKPA